MKKTSVTTLIILIVIFICGYIFWDTLFPPVDTYMPTLVENEDRVMSVDNYVRLYISDLSPVNATYGGTFYVTHIESGSGTGVVDYEDGHIAHTADFTYSNSHPGRITITSFTLRN